MSKSLKIPKVLEKTSVTFVGFPEASPTVFRTLLWEILTEEGSDRRGDSWLEFPIRSGLRGLRNEHLGDLNGFLEDTLKFSKVALRSNRVHGASSFSKRSGFSWSRDSRGYVVYPVSDPRKLKTLRNLGRLVSQAGGFLYQGVPREAQTSRIFPWGFRGLTKDGYRNFRWDRMALKSNEKLAHPTKIVLASEHGGGSGRISLWVDDGYENPHGLEGSTHLQEVIHFKGKRILNPEGTLRRQNTRNPTGG